MAFAGGTDGVRRPVCDEPFEVGAIGRAASVGAGPSRARGRAIAVATGVLPQRGVVFSQALDRGLKLRIRPKASAGHLKEEVPTSQASLGSTDRA